MKHQTCLFAGLFCTLLRVQLATGRLPKHLKSSRGEIMVLFLWETSSSTVTKLSFAVGHFIKDVFSINLCWVRKSIYFVPLSSELFSWEMWQTSTAFSSPPLGAARCSRWWRTPHWRRGSGRARGRVEDTSKDSKKLLVTMLSSNPWYSLFGHFSNKLLS